MPKSFNGKGLLSEHAVVKYALGAEAGNGRTWVASLGPRQGMPGNPGLNRWVIERQDQD